MLFSSAVARAEVRFAGRALPIRVVPGVTCLNEAALQEALERALQSPPPADVEVEVIGSPDNPRSVSLHVHHPDGSESVRDFTPAPERCEHLHQSVALALALGLDAATEPSDASSAAATRGAAEAAQGPFFMGVGALLVPALLGDIAGGGELQTGLRKRWFGLRIGFVGLRGLPQRLPHGGHFSSSLLVGRVDVCGIWGPPARLSAEFCVGSWLGRYRIAGRGFDDSQSARPRFTGFTAGIDLVRGLPHNFALRGSAGCVVTLQPASVVARDDEGEIVDRRDLSRVGGALSLGVDYRF